MKRMVILATGFALLVFLFAFAKEAKKEETAKTAHPSHIMISPAELQWSDAPPSLPPGAKVAVLEGDPSQAGAFTMRLKLPAGYKVPPHWHPADEHVTVISGGFFMGMGEKFNEKAATQLPVGGFAMMATGTRHFAFTREGATVQLHGTGPWGINYVNPADDPRQAQTSK